MSEHTLQGWLKGINSDLLTPKTDMGQDGAPGTANALVGRDAFGMSIGYYGDDDYSAIDDARWDNQYGTKPVAAVGGTGTLAAAHNPLYNGNIAHTVNSLQPWGGWTAPRTASGVPPNWRELAAPALARVSHNAGPRSPFWRVRR